MTDGQPQTMSTHGCSSGFPLCGETAFCCCDMKPHLICHTDSHAKLDPDRFIGGTFPVDENKNTLNEFDFCGASCDLSVGNSLSVGMKCVKYPRLMEFGGCAENTGKQDGRL